MEALLRCRRGSNVASLLRCGWRGGAVVEWWLSKITKVKEKRYLKINSPIITYRIPLHKRLGLTTTIKDIFREKHFIYIVAKY